MFDFHDMTALVTGCGGFLGRAVITRLIEAGARVRGFARSDYPDLAVLGFEMVRGDLADADAVLAAARGCDVALHIGAKVGVWGPYDDYHRANVIGTENVIDACRACGITRLVYTSSPSVVFDGKCMEGVDESVPYARHFLAHYPRTKAVAEQAVRAASDGSLATVALRPHLIWGPRDTHIVPNILKRAHRLRRIGRANPLVDSVYIDNAVDAHLLAVKNLTPGSPAAGRAYFISNGEPWPVWDLINAILEAGGKSPVRRSVPIWSTYVSAGLCEWIYRRLQIEREPPLTRFGVKQLTTSHWFDISAARRDLDYQPRVTIRQGLERLRDWLSGRKSC